MENVYMLNIYIYMDTIYTITVIFKENYTHLYFKYFEIKS